MNSEDRLKTLRYLFIWVTVVLACGCNGHTGQKNPSTVSVFGTGTVYVKPDMVQMNIQLSKTASSTKLAQEEVGKMIRQALEILNSSGIADKNIVTSSLIFRPEYEYSYSRHKLVGQTAQQAITFSIDDIQQDNAKISRIIDQLVQINGLELNQINFSVKNNTEYYITSRELAFQKASEKAKQYADLSGCKVIKVLSISEDGGSTDIGHNRMVAQNAFISESTSDMSSTILPSGELQITTKILAEFLLE